MKKILTILVLMLMSLGAFAQMTREQNAQINAAARMAQKGQALLVLARQGKVAEFRRELVNAPYDSLREADAYGNNILHLASSKEMFAFVWNVLDEHSREALLSQRNKSGEIPMMTHVMYDHEDIFLQYFPQTSLYRELKKTTLGLQDSGLTRHVAEIKKADLIKQCSMGHQTMWQRAYDFYQDTYVQPSFAKYNTSMWAVSQMIAEVAPFLVTRG